MELSKELYVETYILTMFKHRVEKQSTDLFNTFNTKCDIQTLLLHLPLEVAVFLTLSHFVESNTTVAVSKEKLHISLIAIFKMVFFKYH